MDGTPVESEPLHLAVTRGILAHLGHDFTEQDNQAWIGRSTGEMWIDLVERLGLPESADAYLVEYDRELLPRLGPPLEAAAGATMLVCGVPERGVPLPLASSSLRHYISLRAAKRLGVEPSACLVFEDSPAGVTSARTAGMQVIAVQTPHTRPGSLAQADQGIASLACLDPARLPFTRPRGRSELYA
jgi:pseudouridine-5'-monophosphatase